jgi:hypothetical protein
MLRSHRPLSFLLLTVGSFAPAMAHAEDPGVVSAPPAAPPPAPAPTVTTAPAPAPAAPEAGPAPTAAVASAPAPSAPTAAPPEAIPSAAATSAAPADAAATPAATSDEISSASLTTPAASTPAVALPVAGTAADSPSAAAPVRDPYVHVPFDIGLFPPLSVNGSHRNRKVRNTISLGLGWTRTDRLEGAAAAVGATVVDEDARGVTGALGANLTRGEHRGMQFTGGYNHAGSLHGVQMGAINHAGEARGVQSGLINVSSGRIRGVQFGLINYAEEADASFALIPVTKKGGVRPEVWTSDTAAINVGLRLPANYTYAFFAGGLHPIARTQPSVEPQGDRLRSPGLALMAGMGFGGHLPVTDDVAIDGDLSGWVVTGGLRAAPPVAGMTTLRAMVSWQLRPRLAVWGGPTFNVMVDWTGDEVPRPGYGWVAGSHREDHVRIRWWPGFAAGLRF